MQKVSFEISEHAKYEENSAIVRLNQDWLMSSCFGNKVITHCYLIGSHIFKQE